MQSGHLCVCCVERVVISLCVYTAGENNFVYGKLDLIMTVRKHLEIYLKKTLKYLRSLGSCYYPDEFGSVPRN